jgi:hypothetical protein
MSKLVDFKVSLLSLVTLRDLGNDPYIIYHNLQSAIVFEFIIKIP